MSPADPRDPENHVGPPPPGRADPVGRERREFISLMASRVGDAPLRKPFYVDGGTDLVTPLPAARRARPDRRRWSATATALGIFTTTDLRDALLLGVPPEKLPVRDVAIFEPLSVSADAELFDALILMLRHGFHRLIVRDGDEIVGVLTQLDLMAFVANHSQLIALEAEPRRRRGRARRGGASDRRDDPGAAATTACASRSSPASSASSTGRSSSVSGRCSRPQELRANSCLVVMGSEGRGEQIVKTDQDNALILRDGFAFDGLEAVTEAFTAALIEFGYPPCPGGIMLSRPLWRQPLDGFRAALRDWTHGSDPDGPMNLAIFLDAAAVAGDARLLDEARAYVDGCSPAATPSTPASPAPSSSSAAAAGGAACRACAGARRRRSTSRSSGSSRSCTACARSRCSTGVADARHRRPAARARRGGPDRRRARAATSSTRCTS